MGAPSNSSTQDLPRATFKTYNKVILPPIMNPQHQGLSLGDWYSDGIGARGMQNVVSAGPPPPQALVHHHPPPPPPPPYQPPMAPFSSREGSVVSEDTMSEEEDDSEPEERAGKGASSRGRKRRGGGHSRGRWTAEEHEAFLKGLRLYGREWKRVAADIRTRTSAQIRSHAQKYFAKLAKSRPHARMQPLIREDGEFDLAAVEEAGGFGGTSRLLSIQDEAALLNEVGDVLRKLRERRENLSTSDRMVELKHSPIIHSPTESVSSTSSSAMRYLTSLSEQELGTTSLPPGASKPLPTSSSDDHRPPRWTSLEGEGEEEEGKDDERHQGWVPAAAVDRLELGEQELEEDEEEEMAGVENNKKTKVTTTTPSTMETIAI